MLKKFINDEAGAVTIDWVALTAGILLLGIAVVYGIFEGGVSDLATSINSNLAGAVSVPTDLSTPSQSDFSGGGTDGGGADPAEPTDP
ncbi:MAG: hypothetical protein ACFB03_04595 [Paracoccaceae bacterium]